MSETIPIQVPPHDIEAEIVCLGETILSEGENIPSLRENLRPEDFYRPAHQTLCRVLFDMTDAKRPIDLTTVKTELERQCVLEQVGGMDYVKGIIEGTPNSGNWAYYAKTIRDKAIKRELIRMGHDIVRGAYTDTEDSGVLLAEAQQRTYDLGKRAQDSGDWQMGIADAGESVLAKAEAVQREPGKYSGLMTGFEGFDKSSGGLQAGDYIILAALTGAGKTTLAMNIAANIASGGGSILYISAEMLPRELGQRFLQARSDVWGTRIRTGRLEVGHWEALSKAQAEISQWKIELIGRAMTVPEIVLIARRLTKKWGGISLIVADYIQQLKPSGGRSRYEQVSGISWSLKQAAMELEVPVLALSQFDRSVAKGMSGKGRKPSKHDLKESGDIENDANAVWLLHRPEDSAPDAFGTIEVWAKVDKCRDGVVTPWEGQGAIRLKWKPSVTRFWEVTS